jgi:hypothetical protein
MFAVTTLKMEIGEPRFVGEPTVAMHDVPV